MQGVGKYISLPHYCKIGNKMPDKDSVVILKDLAAGLLGTLGANIAIPIEVSHATGLLNAYLMKKVSALIAVTNLTPGQGPIIVGMARGGASVTEIKTAIENPDVDRNRKGQASVRDVLHETLVYLKPNGVADTADKTMVVVSLGGGKGIPFDEGEGWQWFAYNADTAALSTTDPRVHVNVTYWGAWLGN